MSKMDTENIKDKCRFCVYLKKYDNEFIKNINNSIVTGIKYKDILELFNDSKVLNDLQKPSKHHSDCLKDFKPIKLVVSKMVDAECSANNIEKSVFKYTDYSDIQKSSIPNVLKNEMMNVACKLIDIANYRLDSYTGIGGNSESVKDTVASLKIIIDLFNTDLNSTDTNTDECSSEYLNDKELKEIYEKNISIDNIHKKARKRENDKN